MPTVADTVTQYGRVYVWTRCPECYKERWVRLTLKGALNKVYCQKCNRIVRKRETITTTGYMEIDY